MDGQGKPVQRRSAAGKAEQPAGAQRGGGRLRVHAEQGKRHRPQQGKRRQIYEVIGKTQPYGKRADKPHKKHWTAP
ncbi:hypothetical protein AGMMS49974_11560 [Deltaproteobacteria bacterium]|nr:hypothetical protein AGMMS49974_11560 [Deltaproteobacteria bacterium]GHU97656.1 hypothetical protein AGMMS50248_02610 [Deltaproteobacteria bacterium]